MGVYIYIYISMDYDMDHDKWFIDGLWYGWYMDYTELIMWNNQ